ncbi:hypothetical protein [uncultured Rhodospira sp.]|uniref:DUF6931 family protein n=1 Tax=uncultured Rhodospira sp. TaxID=1936189 RepID=UPI0026191F71|nr:hypothetical protein [uncultured Rhodospira sp.]
MAREPGADTAQTPRWKKIKATRVADLGLSPDTAEDILGEDHEAFADMPPETVIERLAKADRGLEAMRLLAFALPKREAVWWACLAARADIAADPKPARPNQMACLEAAEAWVYKPVEERRLVCYRAAQACDPDRPAVLAALAAAFSGGSLTPPDSPPEVQAVPPDDALAPLMVGNTLVLATFRTDPVTAPKRLVRFLDQGRNIAQGGTGALDSSPA